MDIFGKESKIRLRLLREFCAKVPDDPSFYADIVWFARQLSDKNSDLVVLRHMVKEWGRK